METETLSALGKQSGLVIATGGGCVTQAANYPLLHQNGSCFWLKRELNRLPTDGRPLSQATKPEQLYALRRPMYEAFADFSVENNGSVDDTVEQILRIWEERI